MTSRVGNAYFVPDDLVTETLIAAVRRGVAVEVILPGEHQDSTLVRGASRHRWGTLPDETWRDLVRQMRPVAVDSDSLACVRPSFRRRRFPHKSGFTPWMGIVALSKR